MDPLYFMIGFVVAVIVLGTGIFFYWRSMYGVWARERAARKQAPDNEAEVVSFEPTKKP